METDPPPDLVVEIDINHTDINKNAFYAAMGIPEFWRFNGKVWRIYQLQAEEYIEIDRSPTFPFVSKDDLYQFLTACQQDEVEAEINFCVWVRTQLDTSSPKSSHPRLQTVTATKIKHQTE